jgi:hypothetical protein
MRNGNVVDSCDLTSLSRLMAAGLVRIVSGILSHDDRVLRVIHEAMQR